MNYKTLTTLALAVLTLCCVKAAAQSGQGTMALQKGGKVVVNSSGPVTVNGWDRDVVEARAMGDPSEDAVSVRAAGDPTRPVVVVGVASGGQFRGRRDVHLVVKVPRYADLEVTENWRGDGNVEVSDVDGSVAIKNGRGDAVARRVGPLQVFRTNGSITAIGVKGQLIVRSINGDVTAENISGAAEVVATNGNVLVRDAGANVRANTASGDIEVDCVKGRADISTASGTITLTGIGGSVDANTASGDVTLNTRIQADGRYRLKTISGEVEVTMQPDPPGFSATLITYSGEIETAFPLKVRGPISVRPNRRLEGDWGEGGQARFELDSFSGSVRLMKAAKGTLKECK